MKKPTGRRRSQKNALTVVRKEIEVTPELKGTGKICFSPAARLNSLQKQVARQVGIVRSVCVAAPAGASLSGLAASPRIRVQAPGFATLRGDTNPNLTKSFNHFIQSNPPPQPANLSEIFQPKNLNGKSVSNLPSHCR